MAREEEAIEKLKREIERRKTDRKEEAARSRVERLEAAIEARRELERELADIRDREEKDTRPIRKHRRINTEGDRHIVMPQPTQSREATDNPVTIYRPRPKIEKLPQYRGKSLMEAQTFYTQAERRFLQDKGVNYLIDTNKILFCMASFKPKVEWRWTIYKEEVGIGNTTWEEFKDFL